MGARRPSRDGAPFCSLTRLPNTAFGVSMGLSGHAVMWKSMHLSKLVGGTPIWIVWALWLAGAASLTLFAAAFVIKLSVSQPVSK